MTQREFERRVKGTGVAPRGRVRPERSHSGRIGTILRAVLAMLCVAALLEFTADGNRYFSFHRDASRQAVQLTEEQAVAQASAAPAAAAPAQHHVLRDAHHRRVAAATQSARRHASAAGAHRHSSGAIASVADHAAHAGADLGAAAVDASTDAAASTINSTVAWLHSAITSTIAPLVGNEAAENAADSVAFNLPMVAGAGAFIVVMLLMLGAGMLMSSRANRAQSAEVYR
jgi:hypothetical protein